MRSTAATVADYIEEAPAERRDALRLLRRLCGEELEGFEEGMSYGMASYARDGLVEIGFASQKSYIALYVLRRAALQANLERLVGLSVGKGCIRFRQPGQIDPETIRALLAATVADRGAVC